MNIHIPGTMVISAEEGLSDSIVVFCFSIERRYSLAAPIEYSVVIVDGVE